MISGIPRKPRLTRKRVYISGPLLSSGDVHDNLAAAAQMAIDLIELGYAPLCPHLTWYLDPDAEIAHSIWMEVDLPWVAVSDAIIRLPGPSSGADQETREAFNRGIPVFTSIEELRAAGL